MPNVHAGASSDNALECAQHFHEESRLGSVLLTLWSGSASARINACRADAHAGMPAQVAVSTSS